MLSKKQVEIICKGLPSYYQKVGLDVLMDVAKKAAHEAEKNYKKLPNPKTRSLFFYVAFWTKTAVVFNEYNSNIGVMVRKLEEQNEFYKEAQEKHIQAQVEYMKTVLPERDDNDALQEEKTPNIEDIWKEIDDRVSDDNEAQILKDYMPMFKELEPKYANLVKSHNKQAKARGFKSQIDLVLRNENSKKVYQYFLDNLEKVIKYCQKQIPDIKLPKWFYSQFNNPQTYNFLSLLQDFPKLSFPDGILDFVGQEYPILNKFRNRIKIELDNRNSQAYYVKETDSFNVIINKNISRRQQIIELIHELGDIIADLKHFEANWDSDSKIVDSIAFNPYWIEFELLKKISQKVYQARIANILINLTDTQFLIEAYKNPNQDLPKLYAKTFNRCFSEAKQTKNYTFLIKKHLAFHPFSTLPQLIAQVKVLRDFLEK